MIEHRPSVELGAANHGRLDAKHHHETYPDYPRGMPTTRGAPIDADLLAFVQG